MHAPFEAALAPKPAPGQTAPNKKYTYLRRVQLRVGIRLLFAAVPDQVHGNVFNFLAVGETFEGEGEADAPCAA